MSTQLQIPLLKIKINPFCTALRDYLNNTPDNFESIDELCNKAGIDISDKRKVYSCFTYWRKKFKEYYKDLDTENILQGTSDQKWLQAINIFESQCGVQPLFHDKIQGEYFVPNFSEKEEIDKQRTIHWIKSFKTVINEMVVFGETFEITGKTPEELAGDAKLITDKILNGPTSTKCKVCNEFINPNLSSCPNCGNQLTKIEVN